MTAKSQRSRLACAVLAVVMPLSIVACTADEQTDATSVPPGTVTPPPGTPASTTAAPTATPPGLDAATGPVVVVAVPRNRALANNQTDYSVQVVDIATRQVLADYEVKEAVGLPAGISLRGDRVYVAYPDRIAWYAVDGRDTGTVLTAPAGFELLSFDVSDDGTRIAYWKSPLGHETPETWKVSLVLADVASGRVLVEVEDFGGTADGKPTVMVDAFAQYSAWMPGGEAVIANIGSSHDRSLRKVTIDGTVSDALPRGRWGYLGLPGEVAPSMTTAIYPVSAFGSGCPLIDQKDPQDAPGLWRGIRNLETSTDLWSVPADHYLWAAYGSPDGQSFLFGENECFPGDLVQRHWRLVTTANPEAVEVPEPLAVLHEWYGERLPTVRCGSTLDLPGNLGLARVWDLRWGFLQPACDGPVELLVGDTVVATEPTSAEARFLVLRFIEKP